MIWRDTRLCNKDYPSKSLLNITVWFIPVLISHMIFLLIVNARAENIIEDIILPSVVIFILTYLGMCHILLVFRGKEYVKLLEEKDIFEIINIYNEQIYFSIDDVLELKVPEFSFVNLFLLGSGKQIYGLNIILKNGCKYRITTDMEAIESLKDYLLARLKN
ncbi:MAG: hypothetical protein H0U70_12495 [Tatlockia sp.]|nr:hypothetical protein [Tatlockia sp.]